MSLVCWDESWARPFDYFGVMGVLDVQPQSPAHGCLLSRSRSRSAETQAQVISEWRLRKCKHLHFSGCLPFSACATGATLCCAPDALLRLASLMTRCGFWDWLLCDTADLSQIVFWKCNSSSSLRLLLPQPWNHAVLEEGGKDGDCGSDEERLFVTVTVRV